MKNTHSAWKASAAYLYLLHLPDALLAWEYLRRNADYKRQWLRVRIDRDQMAMPWGLNFREDPRRDGRYANPVWLDERALGVRLIADESESALRFNLWAIAGRKALLHDGQQLLVTVGSVHRVTLDLALTDGTPFAYALPSGAITADYLYALRPVVALFQSQASRKSEPPPRPTRGALVHLHTIQALDAVFAGASHRETAIALFGEDAVADRWEPDSELRAQVRHLIRRGRALRDGGYRRLVPGAPRPREGDFRAIAESP